MLFRPKMYQRIYSRPKLRAYPFVPVRSILKAHEGSVDMWPASHQCAWIFEEDVI